jgi:hypothetical protein
MTATNALAIGPRVLRDGRPALIPDARSAPDGKPSYVGSPVTIGVHIVPGTGGHGRARADAFLAVIKPFGCQVAVYGYDANRGDTFLVITGTVPALDALETLLPGLAPRMETSARDATAKYGALLPKSGPTRRAVVTPYFRDYLRGYGYGVAEAIRAARSDMFKIHGPALGELVAESAADVERTFAGRFGTQKPLRRERDGNPLAWQAGAAAGYGAQDLGEYLFIHDLVFAML